MAGRVSLVGVGLFFGCQAHQRSMKDASRAPDEQHFEAWLTHQEQRNEYELLVDFLAQREVAQVVPPWQLLRQGTDWKAVDHPPFAMPPREQWAAIVPTLQFIRDELQPTIGPLQVVSGYRTSEFNVEAGGSPGSRHQFFEAVDLIPARPKRQKSLHTNLTELHDRQGEQYQIGLGLYQNTRFHIDTHRKRTW